MINSQRVIHAIQNEIKDLAGESSEFVRGALWAFTRVKKVVKDLAAERRRIRRAIFGSAA